MSERNYNNQNRNNKRSESVFERTCREERTRRLAHNDVLFFGLSVLLAFYATQNLLTIQ